MVKAYGFNSYGGPEVQQFLELDEPTPLAGEVLIQVKAAGVNPMDWKIRAGYLRETMPVELMPVEFPAVFGSEASGVVRAVGQDVAGFAVGDEVFGRTAPGSGGYAEYTLLTADLTAAKPPHVSFTDAATLPVTAATAYDGVTQLNLKAGQTLLIIGAGGGVGVAASQIARNAGINVVGIASADKGPLLESLGATAVAYGEGGGVADRIRQILPDGVDAIFDLVGGDSVRAVAELLSDRSLLITAVDPETASELGGHWIERENTSRVLDLVAAMVAEGKLDPHVEDILDLDHAADALAAVERGHEKGKVVIRI